MMNKSNVRYLLNLGIMLVLMLGIGYLPAQHPLTVQGMKILGVFVAVLYGWIKIDFIIPSLLGMIAFALSGYMPLSEVYMTGFGADICIFVIFFLAFATIVDDSGVSNIIAGWFISRKIGIGRPWVFSLLILLAAYIIGMAISLVATIIIMWNVFYKICEKLAIKPGDSYALYMLSGILLAATVGYQVFPFKPVPALMIGAYESLSGNEVDFFLYIFWGFVISVLSLGIYLALGKFILKPKMDFLTNISTETFAEFDRLKMTRYQKVILTFLVIVIFLLVLPSILPEYWYISKLLNQLGSTGTVVLLLCIICLTKLDNSEKISLNEVLKKGTQWDVITMMAVMMPMCASFADAKTGILEKTVELLEPLFTHLSAGVFVVLLIVCCYIMIQFIGNVATAAIIVPLMYGFADSLGVDSIKMIILLGISINVGYLTPASSTMAAILHGNKTWYKNKSAYTYGALIIGCNIIACLIVAVFIVL